MRAFIIAALFVAFVCAQTPAPGAPFTSTDCNYYCALLNSTQIRTTCNITDGGYAQFGYAGGIASCVATCQAFLGASSATLNFGGFIGNTSGNTMGCRLYHAGAIILEGAAHCPHASIHGGGVCVTGGQIPAIADSCATWCILLGAACPETYAWNATSFDGTTCGTHCVTAFGIPTNYGFPVSTAGDNLACHQYHGTAALVYAGSSETDRILHCSHSSPLGGGVCSDANSPKRVFCGEVAATCTGNRFPYASPAQCLSDAGNYSTANIAAQFGSVNSTSGDSLACRFYHGSIPAIQDPALHCPHTAWASSTCGTRPSTATPTTAAPTTATTGGASTLVLSVFVVLAALLIAF